MTTLEELLRHEGWIRRLAEQLVAPSDVDDVVQQTWLAAVRRPPAGLRGARAWLGSVVRRCSKRKHRDSMRRQRREALAASAESLPPTDLLLERMELHRRLVDHLMALPEPYRRTLILRFFEGLDPTTISSRSGVKEATVRSHVHRGLARLRARLEAEEGQDWRLGLSPFISAMSFRNGSRLTTGVALMSNTVKLSALLLVAAGLIGLCWPLLIDTPQVTVTTDPPEGTSSQAHAPPATSRKAERAPTPPKRAIAKIRGRVLDIHGKALAAVPLHTVPFEGFDAASIPAREPCAISDSNGQFEVPRPPEKSVVVCSGDHVAIRSTLIVVSTKRLLVVVAPTVTATGQCIDARTHAPIAGARVRTVCWTIPTFPKPLDGCVLLVNKGRRTSSTGRFELARIPATAHSHLQIDHEGFEPQFVDDLTHDRSGLQIELKRESSGPKIRGRVQDATEHPVSGVILHIGKSQTESDALGRFTIVRTLDASQLVAAKLGFQPVTHEVTDEHDHDTPIVLTLRVARSIRGQLVHADGAPAAGFEGILLDATRFAGKHSAEQIAAGITRIITNDDGHFQFEGLRDKRYRVRFFDPQTLVAVQSLATPGAEDLRIELPAEPAYRELRGTTVAPDGTKVPGVKIEICLYTHNHNQVFGLRRRLAATSGADGSFVLRNVPRRYAHLTITGPEIVPTHPRIQQLLTSADSDGKLRILTARRCHVRVAKAHGEIRHAQIRFVDSAGKRLQVCTFSENFATRRMQWPLRFDASEVMSVAETACAAVYVRDGVEIRRDPLKLVPGQVVTIHP